MSDYLIVSDEDAVRVITMRRPEKKNALTQDMYRAMTAAIDSAQNDPTIRCLIITGGSGVFTAGNDLEDFLKAGTDASGAPRVTAATDFLYALARNTKPLIAAVDGLAIGIGTTLLFHCDYVLASTSAVFSTPFIQLGLVPEGASSLLAPRAMGHHRAFAMLVMGRKLSADDARDAGFVNAVVAPGHTEEEAMKAARDICALPAEAVAISRKLIKPSPTDLIARIDQESKLFGERMKSQEAIGAFTRFFQRKKG
ncbi:Enoyl-CoA hydratase [Rhodopseudomonas palustris HaA2]|uniref:Enoyl-CoA hydratase n=1 Tax=Rhodopseudomonas palustris (strain HaA2) TaxID=316058 RepID=Q2IRM2_RHOP2|nr:crotonase/enoyl-CoA hydratase family protein [Rhodopseudomonas palustris]ABD09138.1 Enoyl-CoA hydratase [Rhodopseudomonas palustris HaA2]